jgi:hypothetical protein
LPPPQMILVAHIPGDDWIGLLSSGSKRGAERNPSGFVQIVV